MKPKQKVEWEWLTPEERKDKVRYHANNCAVYGEAVKWLKSGKNERMTVADLVEIQADSAEMEASGED
jgi:hypothetical protein